MDESVTTLPKKTARTRKTISQTPAVSDDALPAVSTAANRQPTLTQTFEDLITKISQSRKEYESSQRQIEQAREEWIREQRQQEMEITQKSLQESLERKREQETYEYSTNLSRKRAEDEFSDRKLAWEKDLAQRKQILEDQRKELEDLRKLAASFEGQKEAVIKETQVKIEKELNEKFVQEKKLADAEEKAEKDLLNMRISNLETENLRLNKDLENLKRSLDEATRQVKEIALKVIESGSNQTKPQVSSQE